MKKAVIFDLDGTLTNTVESIQYSVNKTMDDYGLPRLTKEDCKRFVGDGAKKLIERCMRHAKEAGIDAMDKEPDVYRTYEIYFEQFFMYQVEPYEGIRELLAELKQRGLKIAVLSNKAHERTKVVIETLFGKGYFDEVAGLKPQIDRKPSPDGVFAICKQLQVRPEEVVYVGDTSTDMKTGKSAGCFTVGVLWGFREEKELREHHADAVIGEPKGLTEYL